MYSNLKAIAKKNAYIFIEQIIEMHFLKIREQLFFFDRSGTQYFI